MPVAEPTAAVRLQKPGGALSRPGAQAGTHTYWMFGAPSSLRLPLVRSTSWNPCRR